MRERRIRKVKLDGSRVEITAMETWGVGNEREWTLRCHEDPEPALPESFKALVPEIRALLELPPTWADGALRVISVSFSWSESTEVRGASICCRADLECATSPLIFNTPHLPYRQYSEGGEQPVMPDDLIERLEVLEQQATRYMDGHRAQADLFAAKPAGKDAAAGEGRDEASEPVAPIDTAVVTEAVVAIVDEAITVSPAAEPMPTPGPTKKERVKAAAKATADKYFKAPA